ncbi:MAG: ABC transporter substrate-binding protein [Bacillota bacterium]
MVKSKNRPFTLFLCLLVSGFLILGPIFFIEYRARVYNNLETEKKSDWKGVITVWDYPRLDSTDGTRYGWMTSKIKKFERDNPGVYIVFRPLNPKTGPLELETAARTKTYPDIAPVATEYAYISQNLLESVDPYLTGDEMNDYKVQALSAVRFDGKLWGFPWMMTTTTMLLNVDIFREKGVPIPKDGNWTYQEFVDTLTKLTYDRDGDGKNDVFGFNSYIDLNNYNTWGIILSDGAEIFDDQSNYSFYGDKAQNGLKKLVDLKQVYGVTPNNFGKNSEKEAWDSFVKDRRVAVYPTGTWAINVLEDLRRQGQGFEYAVVNFPIGDSGIPISVANNVSAYGIFKQEDPKKLEMCVKFLKYVTEDQYQAELYKLGVFPAKKTVENIYKNNRMMARIEETMPYAKGLPRHPHWMTIDGILQSQIRQAVLGSKTVEEALNEARQKVESYLSLLEK